MFLGSVRQIGQLDSESGLASGWTLVAETGAVCVCVCVGGCMCMCMCVCMWEVLFDTKSQYC